ncbi:MAG TPA: hypothetical protein VGP72_25720 [Planctomycetota bacterium]|jgi:uncharacterized coiled-coil protein SlyX
MEGNLVIFGIFVMPLLLAGFAVLLKHREKMARLQATSAPDSQVSARVAQLEKQCAALQEQIKEIHFQLADEKRQLDLKLQQHLDQPIAAPGEERKTIGASRVQQQ